MTEVIKYPAVVLGLSESEADYLRESLRVGANLASNQVLSLSALGSSSKEQVVEMRRVRDNLRSLYHRIGGLRSDGCQGS